MVLWRPKIEFFRYVSFVNDVKCIWLFVHDNGRTFCPLTTNKTAILFSCQLKKCNTITHVCPFRQNPLLELPLKLLWCLSHQHKPKTHRAHRYQIFLLILVVCSLFGLTPSSPPTAQMLPHPEDIFRCRVYSGMEQRGRALYLQKAGRVEENGRKILCMVPLVLLSLLVVLTLVWGPMTLLPRGSGGLWGL